VNCTCPLLSSRLWASFWYDGVHKSTGFYSEASSSASGDAGTYRPSAYKALSSEQLQAYREALPFYDLLQYHAVSQDVLARGCSHCPPDMTNAAIVVGGDIIDHGKTISPTAGPEVLSSPSLLLTDHRNANILIWVGDRLLPREYARVSVFDSSVQGGDAVWEGVRVYDGRVFMLSEHIDRLFDSAHAMDYQGLPSREYIYTAVFNTLRGRSGDDTPNFYHIVASTLYLFYIISMNFIMTMIMLCIRFLNVYYDLFCF
jgi:hypothetical protein